MTAILCFGDSNTWGLCPETGQRLAKEQRWPSLLETFLNQSPRTQDFEVIEAGQPNRTLFHHCAFTGTQAGRLSLVDLLQLHQPKHLVIMLGTNDLKAKYHYTPADFAFGLERLLKQVFAFYDQNVSFIPKLVVLSPLAVLPVGQYRRIYAGSADKLPEVIVRFAQVCAQYQVRFIDCNHVVHVCPNEGVHLSATQHQRLAQVLVPMFNEHLPAEPM